MFVIVFSLHKLLYNKLKEDAAIKQFGFINPSSVSSADRSNGKAMCEDKARAIAN